MTYRLLVLDVDGTLLDSAHILRPRVADAVRSAQTAGLTVALATGKLLSSVQPLLDAMGVRGPQIVLNGAAIRDTATEATVRFCPLNEGDRRAVIETVRAADRDVLISHFALDTILVDRPHPMFGIFAEYGEGPVEFVDDLLMPGLPPAAKILVTGVPEQLVALRKAVTPHLEQRVLITTTTPQFLEFFDFAAGKGQALSVLRDALNVPREAIIAMGDGENDVPLLREAGLSVAMANGAEGTRAIADRIAPSNDEDGVAVVLEALLQGE
ncbi:MAG: Cof-type HAD-IIB family hydrolase [Ktedonobacterales bacterium]